MPPSSRKRNKGKERKAKQQAKKEENDRADARIFWRSHSVTITGCNHGCDMIPADDHPVISFMDQFYINLRHKRMTIQQTLRNIFETHRQIWKNECYRKLAICILTRIGTNMLSGLTSMLLDEDLSTSWLLCLAQTILALEHYDGKGDIDSVINERLAASKIRDLQVGNSSSRRDCLKFYRKRISCKCLKKMHLEARKALPKVGNCYSCGKEWEREVLFVCSRCMVHQYCSRECQVAAWHEHKEYCDEYVKRNNANSTAR